MPDAVYDIEVTEGQEINYNYPNALTVGTFTVSWRAISETASYQDYVFSPGGPLVMTPGNGDKSVKLFIIDDKITEDTETFTWTVTQTASVGSFTTSYVAQYNFRIKDNDEDSPAVDIKTGLPSTGALTSNDDDDEHQSFDTDAYRFDPISKLWSVVKNGKVVLKSAVKSTESAIFEYISDQVVDKVQGETEEYIEERIPAAKVAFNAWSITESARNFYNSKKKFITDTSDLLSGALSNIVSSANIDTDFDILAVENGLKQHHEELRDEQISNPIPTSLSSVKAISDGTSVRYYHSDISAHIDIDLAGKTTSISNHKVGHRSISIGSEKNDTIYSGDLGDVAYGSSGNDKIYGGNKKDMLLGGDGADVIDGGGGDDIISGGNQNDTINGNVGADVMRGGEGNDAYTVDNVNDKVVEQSGSRYGIDTVKSSVSIKVLSANVENLTLTGTTAISGTGNALANTIVGNGAANVLDGDRGADQLSGGLGNDTYRVDEAGDRVFEKAGEGKDTVRASVSYVLAAGQEIETLELAAGRTNLNLTGNGFANTLRDNAGDNRLDGGGGDDFFISMGGRDDLIGGRGNDSAVIDRAAATVALSFVMASVNGVTTLVGDGTTTSSVGNITLTGGTGDDTFVTLSGTDVLKGGAGNDTLDSGTGNDRLDGGLGADRLVGGLGDDVYLIDNAGDRVVEATGGGLDKVVTAISYGLSAGQEIEVLEASGSAGRTLVGNAFGQTLTGNGGANTLDGKLGADLLVGGRGADTFVFSTALGADNVDRIADFATGDTIRLSKSVFAALAPGRLAEGAFKTLDTAEIDADDRILYKQSTGELFYDADGSGNAAAILFAVLDNKPAITPADLFVA